MGTRESRKTENRFQKVLSQLILATIAKRRDIGSQTVPRRRRSSSLDFSAVAEDEAKSDTDIALVVHGHTHSSDVWVLDTGASYHMTPKREWFSEYTEVLDNKIKMAKDCLQDCWDRLNQAQDT